MNSGAQNIQKQAFGPDWKPTSKDMSDYSTAAYNYMMKQQEQAYNLELWNLQNEYNSPAPFPPALLCIRRSTTRRVSLFVTLVTPPWPAVLFGKH